MIAYEEGRWGILFAFSLHGSVLPRGLVWGISGALLSVGLHLVVEEIDDDQGEWRDDFGSDTLKGFTWAMGFALVMRTQKAYTRWWEGGTNLEQVRGEWFNAVSNLIAFCNPDPKRAAEVERLQHQMVRLFSLLYGNALLQVSTMSNNEIDYIDLDGFDSEDIQHMRSSPDTCELVLQWIQRIIVETANNELIKIAPPILSRVYNQLGNGIVRLNNARKIRDFPVPFPLAQLVTFMLLVHWMTTIIICAITINSVPMKAIIAFTVTAPLWGINYMSVELENPFGDDANDLPLRHMQSDMNKSLRSLLHPKTLKIPSYSFVPEKARPLELKLMDFGASWSGHANKYGFLNTLTKNHPTAHLLHHNHDKGGPSGTGQQNDVEQKAPVGKQIQNEMTHMAAPGDLIHPRNPRQGGVERQFSLDLQVCCADMESSAPVDFTTHHVMADFLHVGKKSHTTCLSDGVPHEEVLQPSTVNSFSNRDKVGSREKERALASVQCWPREQVESSSSTVVNHLRGFSLEQTHRSAWLSSLGNADHSSSCDRAGSNEAVQSRHLKQGAHRLCLGTLSLADGESHAHRCSSEKVNSKQHAEYLQTERHKHTSWNGFSRSREQAFP